MYSIVVATPVDTKPSVDTWWTCAFALRPIAGPKERDLRCGRIQDFEITPTQISRLPGDSCAARDEVAKDAILIGVEDVHLTDVSNGRAT